LKERNTEEQRREEAINFLSVKFEKYFYNSPVKRIGWISFLRNVIIASGNSNSKILEIKLEKLLN